MKIQPIVIGTAGHIDHGKSSLVRALTGTDPDRWAEEKERGMTIDLGFARFELPDGRLVGLVDVPGHERFVRNMVAGASGIDLVILVVAADDGVMPQTREHLAIMGLLGVERGIVALNKVDLVEPELAELAEEDVREALEGTFLEGAPVLHVSATTGQGLDALREHVIALASEIEPRPAEGVFRMPVQRVFSARGFGTILTGIPVSGTVQVGDALEVLPGGQRGKVRGLQAYHEATESGRAGHSTAINLTDVDHNRVERGHVVATPGFFQAQRMVGARLRALGDLDFPITNRMQVRLHTGTSDGLGEVVLLDRPELAPGEEGLVQLRMQEPVVCAPGDRFVLRLASPVLTLGGGVVLEESRHRLKRFKDFVIEELERQASSLDSPATLLDAHLRRLPASWGGEEELAVLLKRGKPETRELLLQLAEQGSAHQLAPGRWIHADVLERVTARTRDAIARWFEDNPTRARMDVRDLRASVDLDKDLLDLLLGRLAEAGEVRRDAGGTLVPAGREVELDEATAALRDQVRAAFDGARFQPPSPEELAAQLSRAKRDVDQVVQLLVDQGELEHVGGTLFLSRAAADEARASVVDNCTRNGQLEIPELRDALGTSRKFLIPLLEHFDTQGLTVRRGGSRILKRR